MSDPADRPRDRGPIAWMTRNRVTPNLLMLVALGGGFYMASLIKQEVFPEFDLDRVTVQVPYPGASPEEVEQGIILAIEEGIRGIDGIKEVTATAGEGMGTVTAELLAGVDDQRVYQDIKQEIDRITTFPEDAEEPSVSLVIRRRGVLVVELYGQASEMALHALAEQVRDRLLQNPGITQVDLLGARDHEVQAEIDRGNLRAYGLTPEEVAERIRATSVELPGGSVKTRGGEILLRVKERRDWAREFAKIPIVTTADGTVVYLADIAKVRDDFDEVDRFGTYDGYRSIGLDVYRVGEQTPIGVSDAVRSALKEIRPDLPEGISLAINRDMSDIYRQRLHLLLRNAFLGLMAVLCVLGLFLEFKLAFWVTMGIPVSFLGAFLFLPGLDVTINMISMFAFIIALGIVVDDAIVAGENIYEYRQQGMNFIAAAIRGARDVSVPIAFSILTNIVAFLPLMFVPGIMGKIWRVIPLVVTTVFAISWFEALFILPAHLAHVRGGAGRGVTGFLHRRQQAFSRLVSRFIYGLYAPFLDRCVRFRYLTVAIAAALLTIVVAYALSGRMGIILMPKVESDRAVVTAVLPYGSPLHKVEAVRDRLVGAVNDVAAAHGGDQLVTGVFALVNENTVEVTAHLTKPGVRPISTAAVTSLWRRRAGDIKGLESLRYESDRGGPGRGAAVTVELAHRDIEVLRRAGEELAEALDGFAYVKDADDGFTPGKQQLDFRVKPEGRSLGLTSRAIARQVRSAFYGAEALRQQRGRNEVKVKVRLPKSQRTSEYDVEELLIRTPAGRDVPLRQVAEVRRGRAYTTISRRNGRRTIQVTADVEPISETSRVLDTLAREVLPDFVRDHPGLSFSFEGRRADLRESTQSLIASFVLALLAIYVLLAIPFHDYIQPMIVMMAIPFGIVGAVIGHLVMGYSLSLISLMGIVALSGVVVNDALVMVDYANRVRAGGADAMTSIHQAGVRRFRPILLTTLTTFGGLAPMIFETSRQARFMIPMALSLGYGIVFATTITLVLVPCLYLIIEDARRGLAGLRKQALGPAPAAPAEQSSRVAAN